MCGTQISCYKYFGHNKDSTVDPFSTGKMEVEYIWAAHSIPLSILNRLIPIMPLKSEFLAPASRSKVPRASIGARARKNAIFLNRRDELLIYFTWNWSQVAGKMILEDENVCPHIHDRIWEKKCIFFSNRKWVNAQFFSVKSACRKNLTSWP